MFPTSGEAAECKGIESVDDRGEQRGAGIGSITGAQVPPGCRYLAAHSAGKLFTGLFKRNLLKLTDFISHADAAPGNRTGLYINEVSHAQGVGGEGSGEVKGGFELGGN